MLAIVYYSDNTATTIQVHSSYTSTTTQGGHVIVCGPIHRIRLCVGWLPPSLVDHSPCVLSPTPGL